MTQLPRRQLIGAGLGILGALAGARSVAAAPRDDAAVLERLIALEQRAASTYAALAEAEGVGELESLFRLFAEQEEQHARGLERAVKELGGRAPATRDGSGVEPVLTGRRSDVIRVALELEDEAVAVYYDAQARLSAPELLVTTASIMASQAQHQAILRDELGRDPAPDAFVGG